MRIGRRLGRNPTPHLHRLVSVFAVVFTTSCFPNPTAAGAEPEEPIAAVDRDPNDGVPGTGPVERASRSPVAGGWWQVVGVVSLCAVESLLIAGLVVQLVKRRRAEAQFRQVVETAPTGLLVVSRDGTLVMVNGRVEEMYGYRREEVLGRPVEVLAPEYLRDQYAADRARFFAAPQPRPLASGWSSVGRRKDGTEFPIEVGLTPLWTPCGDFVLMSLVDVTERQRAESALRGNRQELQLLTRRLLGAQEDERRRIARELHDDLNQSLALLAVEIDLLARRPPASAGAVADRLRSLSSRVKELSSSVHDLAHQLHPSKLEQLGLVAAVRDLCLELGRHHGLEVTFTHSGVPDPIPEDVALCLYRIVQEALRNVIKHSGTGSAVVELTGMPDGIHLLVGDNGAGFDPGAIRGRGGLGLVGMRERLNLVGGEIRIDSRPAGGTRIEIHVATPTQGLAPSSLQAEVAGC